eukprot:2581424-Rhodomonas_salina.4
MAVCDAGGFAAVHAAFDAIYGGGVAVYGAANAIDGSGADAGSMGCRGGGGAAGGAEAAGVHRRGPHQPLPGPPPSLERCMPPPVAACSRCRWLHTAALYRCTRAVLRAEPPFMAAQPRFMPQTASVIGCTLKCCLPPLDAVLTLTLAADAYIGG